MALTILCRFGHHLAPHPYFAVRSGDTWFGDCPRCHEQIVKQGKARWRTVPNGFRVVWRFANENGALQRLPSIEAIERR